MSFDLADPQLYSGIPRHVANKRGVNSLSPVFLDRVDLASSSSLSYSVEQALTVSQALIVVCSPDAAASSWVNQEIMFFHRLGRGAHIFCYLVVGEFIDAVPPAVFELLEEPLAADARGGNRRRRRAYHRLVAGLLEVPLAELSRWGGGHRHSAAVSSMHASSTPIEDVVKRRELAAGILRDAGGTTRTLRAGIGYGLDLIRSEDEVRDDARLQMLQTLAESYRRLGEFDSAVRTFEQALNLCRELKVHDGIEAAHCLHGLAAALRDKGQEQEALEYAERSLELKRELLGPDHIQSSITLSLCANVLVGQGQQERGLSLVAEAVKICAADPGGEDFAEALWQQGSLLRHAGHLDEACPILERSVALHRDLYGRLDPRFAIALNAYALCLRESGEWKAAKPLYEQVLSIYQRIYTEAHPETARALNNFGVVLDNMGEKAEARRNLELAVAQWRSTIGEDHSDTLTSRHLLARLLLESGHRDEAVADLEDIIARADAGAGGIFRTVSGHVRTTMARACLQMGDFERSEAIAREAVERLASSLPIDHWRTVSAMRLLGEVLMASGELDESGEWLDRAGAALDRQHHAAERQRLESQRRRLDQLRL